ncbi:MAG: hypothetical protein DI555_06115 [Novosphingobium pentaromativorans]|uniref:TonB C-terminal domain-containing protein n=1 Tax=Novosphingobium pentaromativorans TaxID=205844 RepID=A0A2W5P068_9SPHN|nr:MAG: hypothetical protein DI555_06115 [Novosphingobium pentaromativorans]
MLATVVLAGALVAPAFDIDDVRQMGQAIGMIDPRRSGFKSLLLTVDPEGRVVSCAGGASGGEQRVLAQLCDNAKRVRFAHAASVDGMPAYGRYRAVLNFRRLEAGGPGITPSVRLAPDMSFTLRARQDGRNEPFAIAVNALVAPDGSVRRCEAPDGKPNSYVATVCMKVLAGKLPIVEAASGQATSYVQTFTAHFQFGKTATKELP